MPQEHPTPDPKAGRDRLERIALQHPTLVVALTASAFRMRPGSLHRQRLVSWALKRGIGAMNRGDVEVMVMTYEPDAEVWMHGFDGVGIGGCYHGREGIRAVYAEMDEAWRDWAWTIRAVVDGGDRVALRTDLLGHGRNSGLEVKITDGGTAIRLSSRGMVARQDWFAEDDGWRKALTAAALSE